MKAVLLNGSPREGNSYTALAALKKGFTHIEDLVIEEIAAGDVSVSPCLACEVCHDSGMCVFDDDTNEIMVILSALMSSSSQHLCIGGASQPS